MVTTKHKEFKFLIKLNKIGQSSNGNLSMVAIAFKQLPNIVRDEDAALVVASEQHAQQNTLNNKKSNAIKIEDDVLIQCLKTKKGTARSDAPSSKLN